jgi:hypothetical protein
VPAFTRPDLAALDQGAAQPLAARLGNHIQLGQIAVTAFRLDHEQFGILVMGEGPAQRCSRLLGDQDDAVLFGAAMLQVAPVIGGKIGIAAAVGFERGLKILKAGDEGQDRRLVLRQPGMTNTNGRAP